MAAEPRGALLATLLACALGAAGCSESGTGVDLTIDGPGLTVDELAITATFDGATLERRVTPLAPIALPSRLIAALPARALEVVFDVTGRLGGVEVGRGRSLAITVAPRTIVPGSVSLAGGAPPDLAGVDLGGGDLAGLDLAGADLTRRPITVVGESHATLRDNSTYTLPVAALGVVPGDLLLLVAYAQSGTVATPPGFTLVGSGSNNPGTRMLVYQKRAGAPVETTVQVVNGAATPPNYSAVALVALRGVRPTGDPFDAQLGTVVPVNGVAAAPDITFTAPSIVANGVNDYLLTALFYESGGGEMWTGAPPGMLKLVDVQMIGIFGQLLPAAGATGTRAAIASFGSGNGIEGGAWVGALAPE